MQARREAARTGRSGEVGEVSASHMATMAAVFAEVVHCEESVQAGVGIKPGFLQAFRRKENSGGARSADLARQAVLYACARKRGSDIQSGGTKVWGC